MFAGMQPSGAGARPTLMTRTLPAALAALATSLVLVACGSEPGTDVVVDDPPPSPTPTQTTPTAEPTVGTYPDFAPEDYAYTLVVSCFCPDAGTPVRVTVVDGEAVEAVYARGRPWGDQGRPGARLPAGDDRRGHRGGQRHRGRDGHG